MGWKRSLLNRDMDNTYIAEHALVMWESLTADEVDQFISTLRAYGLQEHEVVILVDRFVSNKTFEDIRHTHSFTRIQYVYEIYKNALKKIEKAIDYLESNS